MSKTIKIKKGFNIKLKGDADKAYHIGTPAELYAVKPLDFLYFLPKLLVKEGDKVKAGDALFFNKNDERIKICAPVSGEIVSINRGEKRVLESIIIKSDKVFDYCQFGKAFPSELNRDQIIEKLLISGIWSFIRQRPFNCIANPSDRPKAIHISCFDSAPLAPDNDFIVHGKGDIFQIGLDAIAKLTTGKLHLNINETENLSKVFLNSKNVQINSFKGPHPSGNVGVQIHHLDPINKGDIVWYLYPQDVLTIGRLFAEGIYDSSRVVALTGSEIKHPKYFKTFLGSAVDFMLENNLKDGVNRIISGNVLTGKKIQKNGFVSYYDYQLSVIPEGGEPEFLGWATPGLKKFSRTKTFLSSFLPKKPVVLNSKINGGERAYVITGQYEQVFPMDIYPLHLIKSIMIEDIDLMEKLGIYEVSEEDFALCEFVCTSKIEVQQIVRKGLDIIHKEFN